MFNFLKKKQTEAETKTEESLIEHYRHKHIPFKKPEINRAKVISQIFQRDFSKLMPKSKNGRAIAMDSSVCSCDLKGNDIPLDILEFYGKHFFIGWQACALLRQNAYIDKACTVPAQDAISCDYKITYAENNEKTEEVDTEKLQEMKRVSDKDYNIKEICYRANVDKKTFGISLVVPVIDGVDYAKPYNIDAVKKGSYKGMTVVEPYWTAPQLDSNAVNNPMNVGFQEPTWWRMPNGTLVHKSWCIKRCNSELPDILKPTYYYGGVPLTQMIYERVYSAEKVANEAPLLALTKRLLIIDANIENLVANEAEAREKINMAQYYRDNFSMWFKNPDDQVQQIDTSLSDFDALVMTQYQLVAAIAEMPATKLLKTQPKGFNATGEFEQKDYIESLQRIQEQDFLPILKMHYELFTKSFYGKVIDLSVVFNPVDTPTEKETAEVAKIWADIDASYVSAGVMSAEEVRDIRRSQEDSPYSTLADDIENEVSQEVEQVADEALDEDDVKYWFSTKSGAHIPVKEGQSQSEAIKSFFEDKKKEESSDLIKDEDENFGKSGTYQLYRAGNLSAPNGMIFLTPSVREATYYADEDTGGKFDKYHLEIKNPLIIEAGGDIEAARKAYKALHGKDFNAKELTSKAWQRLDKANASALKKSDYDSIMYKIEGNFTEVQIVKERAKDLSYKKTYDKIKHSDLKNEEYLKAEKEYMDYINLDDNHEYRPDFDYQKAEELRLKMKKASAKAYREAYGEDEALDDAEFESKHNRDERGRFTSGSNFSNAESNVRYYGSAESKITNEPTKSKARQMVEQEYQKNKEIAQNSFYPENIDGVERGKEMTFEEADGKSVNPEFDMNNPSTSMNCQSCVIAFEARLRGYDVEANLYGTQSSKELSFNGARAWLNKETGEYAKNIVPEDFHMFNGKPYNAKNYYNFLDKTVQKGERYFIDHIHRGRGNRANGHILSLLKDDKGLMMYDPQSSKIYRDKSLFDYLKNSVKFERVDYGMHANIVPHLYRVDNMAFNPQFFDVMTRKK